MREGRRHVIALGLTTALGGLAGCTGSDEDDSSARTARTDATTETTPTPDDEGTADESTTDEPTTEDETTATGDGGDASWPSFQYDAANTGSNPNAEGPREGFDERWRAELTYDLSPAQPTLAGETLLVTSHSSVLYALDAETGDERWQYATDGSVNVSAAIADGTAYVTDAASKLYAVALDSGETAWTADLAGGGSVNSPVVANGAVYVGTSETFDGDEAAVQAFDADTGDERWTTPVETDGATGVAVDSGTAYVGETGGGLAALDAADGSENWRTDAAKMTFPPTVADGTVFVATDDAAVRAFDADTGRSLWSNGDEGTGAPAVADGRVFAAANKDLACYDAAGTELWNTGAIGTFRTPAVAGGTVYAGTDNETLYAIATEDGAERWVDEFEDDDDPTPITVVGERAYFGFTGLDNGAVRCYGPGEDA
ncbi:outer membrane protein assembly factor BamB family protein [Halorussus halobius]|uniref:outer membrane protein assembly factor BamB family protein n=1 Tax=Halorussus halobius TaxID=1710537 RepID=UPI001092BC65|nr:PQQ-binding-like beta-propeller repeat protein [Halorussus halobius]